MWVWVNGIGDCGCGLVGCVDSDVIPVWIVCGLVGCVDSDVIPVWIVCGSVGLFFYWGFFFFLDASVDLIAQWEVGVSILREMVADDGDCGDCVGSVREVTVLKKLIFYLNKCI